MTDRPILFSAPMVRALLDGRKTQTRRVLKPQPEQDGFWRDWPRPEPCGFTQEHWDRIYTGRWPDGTRSAQSWRYEPGDRLWVRETFTRGADEPGGAPWPIYAAEYGGKNDPAYRLLGPWSPAIHMPRAFSRLTLTVTDVRVQRVQEISEADAIAEGVEPYHYVGGGTSYADGFGVLWDSLNAARGFGWDANPWVVCLSFEVHRKNIDHTAELAESQP